MAPTNIDPGVLAFIRERIETVPQLEALLMMSTYRDRTWTANDIASRVYTTLATGQAILEALQRRGLVVPEASSDAFRYSPSDETEAQLVNRVGEVYRANLIFIATFIHDKAPSSVQEFARAFDFKKDR
jgi:hypothetical protein